MIKKLFTIAMVTVSVTLSAQTNGRLVNNVISIETPSEISKSITYNASLSAPGCLTITTSANNSLQINTAGSDTATPGCSPKAGFVFGTNCYDDFEKANFFPVSTYSAITSPSITGVLVSFFKNGTRGTGGAPTTPVNLKLYNGAIASGPTTSFGQSAATMTNILAAQVGTNTVINYLYNFTTAVVAPATGGFFASVVIPTTNPGDTAVVFNSPASPIDYGWELWSDNSWHSISSAWGASLKANLSIYPIICGDIISGISKNLGLSNSINIMPNPSTGLFNIVATLPSTQDLSVTVTNAIGQIIVSNKYNSILTDVINLDLSNQSNGVYFVTLSNGQDKMVQRLILNK